MLLRKPDFYDSFRCLAGSCPDSCCRQWQIAVNPEAAARYLALPGVLGDRLRRVLCCQEGEYTFTLENGRCPMWRSDGLCAIQSELGEDALCHTCREFPRLRHDYGDFVELGLELSCPEAARLILSRPGWGYVTQELPGGEEPEYDREAMDILLRTRERALSLLEEDRPVPEIFTLFLLYGYQAQGELDGAEEVPFDPEAARQTAAQLAKPADFGEILDFFASLELLNPSWGDHLRRGQFTLPGKEALPLLRYFAERYWLQAVSDYDLACRVKFMVVSCLVIRAMDGDFVANAQRFSKELENDPENVEAVLDAAYSHRAFTDDRLLGLLGGARCSPFVYNSSIYFPPE